MARKWDITGVVIAVASLFVCGSLRLPAQNSMDVRLSKWCGMGGGKRVEIQMNLFNPIQRQHVTARTVQSGADYLKPTAIQAARILDFNIAYSF